MLFDPVLFFLWSLYLPLEYIFFLPSSSLFLPLPSVHFLLWRVGHRSLRLSPLFKPTSQLSAAALTPSGWALWNGLHALFYRLLCFPECPNLSPPSSLTLLWHSGCAASPGLFPGQSDACLSSVSQIFMSCFKTTSLWTGEMIQWVKSLPGRLATWVWVTEPVIKVKIGENDDTQLSSDLPMHSMTYVYPPTCHT